MTKLQIQQTIERQLSQQNYKVVEKDMNRPWGGFFVIDENQIQKFAKDFFPNIDWLEISQKQKLSPKILLVAPKKRLSWQYHKRRSEIWAVLQGKVGVIRSDNDKPRKLELFEEGDTIMLSQEERHRLVGLDDWSIIAEIWQHTDPNNPSDEDDIIRLQDDFGR